MVYLDTSALVSLYYPETASERAAAFVAGKPVPFSHLHELEARNALMLKVFRKEATVGESDRTVAAMQEDLKSGSLVRPEVDWITVFRAATALATEHSRRIGARSLDVLHVAAAQALKAERFASFDDRQKDLAKKAGLNVARI